MPVIHLTRKEWDKTLKPVLSVPLQKCGIVDLWNGILLFSAEMHQGMGILHPHCLQHIKQLALLFTESPKNNPLSDPPLSNAKELRCECGFSGHTGDVPFQCHRMLQQTCGLNLFFFCEEHDLCPADPHQKLMKKGRKMHS